LIKQQDVVGAGEGDWPDTSLSRGSVLRSSGWAYNSKVINRVLLLGKHDESTQAVFAVSGIYGTCAAVAGVQSAAVFHEQNNP
jgi:hypothetical protein